MVGQASFGQTVREKGLVVNLYVDGYHDFRQFSLRELGRFSWISRYLYI